MLSNNVAQHNEPVDSLPCECSSDTCECGLEPLGTIAKNVTPPRQNERELRKKERFALLRTVRQILPHTHRTCSCMRSIVPGKSEVNIHVTNSGAHYTNLVVCDNVWTCPVCSSRITEERRIELTDAINRNKQHVIMVTITMQHKKSDGLKDLRTQLVDAWRATIRGNPWKRIKDAFGINGFIRALEVTVSRKNGWHPHGHILFTIDAPLGDDDLQLLEEKLKTRWLAMLEKRDMSASYERGLTVIAGNQALAQYVAKTGIDNPQSPEYSQPIQPENDGTTWTIAHEITKAPVKIGKTSDDGEQHYTPFDLLRLADDPETEKDLREWSIAKFNEYADAMKGAQQLNYSRGLKDRLGIGVDEDQADDPADEQADERVFVALDAVDWWSILRLQRTLRQTGRDIRHELLTVASKGDIDWFLDVLERLLIASDALPGYSKMQKSPDKPPPESPMKTWRERAERYRLTHEQALAGRGYTI